MVEFLVKRPIGTTMVYIAIAALGLLASRQLPISLMPDIEVPEITIQANFENYTAQQMEQSILRPLRSELLQTLHLDDINSEARNGQGTISMRFDYGTNISHAAIEVNEKVDTSLDRLPDGMARPKVIKASAVDIPVFTLNVGLKNKPENTQKFLELSEFAEMVLKRRIEQIPEVALVDMSGLDHPEIRIRLDTTKVLQLGIRFDLVTKTITENNREIGNILIREGHYQYNVKIGSKLINMEDLGNLLIKSKDRIFKLSELSDISLAPKTSHGLYDANGSRAISMAIIKQSDARLEDMASSVKSTISHLEKDYPELTFEITRDQSQLLLVTIDSLKKSLLIGSLLAFLVMFFFLKDIRAPFLIGLSIPVSLIVSLLGFQLLHITINIISLSGLLLGVGMMIDNSIIVIDNITQHIERGSSLREGCIKGAEDVFRPLLSSVLTTCAAFVPLIYLSGISGALFYDQAMAVTIGLSASLGVAVTLIPVYFKLLYNNKRIERWNQRFVLIKTLPLEGLYKSGYTWVITHQKTMAVMLVLILASLYPLYNLVQKEQFPKVTELATELRLDWNENIHVDENRRRVLEVISIASKEISQHNSFIGHQQFILSGSSTSKGGNEALVYVLSNSEAGIKKIKEKLSNQIQQRFPKASFEFSRPQNAFERLFVTDEATLMAKITLDENNTNVLEVLLPIQNAIRSEFPTVQLLPVEKVVDIHLEHENLLLYNVDVSVVIGELQTLLNENILGELKSFQNFTEIKASSSQKNFSHSLGSATVRNKEGNDIHLKYLINTSQSEALKNIYGGKDGSYYPFGFDINESKVNDYCNHLAELTRSFEGASVTFTGSLFKSKALLKELAIVLTIAITLLYFILAAQFESVWQPFIILLEVPMNLMACFIGLYLTNTSLNIMSLIGIVVMSGVVVNDSILKVDTINQLRKEGYATDEAISTGGERRLKPILMTSITTILALVPFLFSNDLGSELQRPLAITVIFGMFSGTIVSLFYVPLFYRWIVRR